MKNSYYYFYCTKDADIKIPEVHLESCYFSKFWRPSLLNIVPSGIPIIPFGIWRAFHSLGVFINKDYCLFIVYHRGIIIHRSCVYPGYFRFPFMAKDDLQIGDTWTHPSYRCKGLATYTIRQILKHFSRPARKFWYIAPKTNIPSIHVAEKGGFTRVGEGKKIKRFYISLLGSYVIEKK